MRFEYILTPEQLVSFQLQFGMEVRTRVVAHWVEKTSGYLAIALFGALCLFFTATYWQAFLLWWAGLILVVLLNTCTRKLTVLGYTKYYRNLPGALEWEQWIDGARFFSRNRDVEYSFPIDASVVLTKDAEFVWLEFNDRGRARIPLSAFESPEQIRKFEDYFAKAKEGTSDVKLNPTNP